MVAGRDRVIGASVSLESEKTSAIAGPAKARSETINVLSLGVPVSPDLDSGTTRITETSENHLNLA